MTDSIVVSARDYLTSITHLRAHARRLAERRAEIEGQHATVDGLRAKAVRVSVDGQAFDMGNDWYLVVHNGPTPRESSVLYSMAVLPISGEDVEDYHGGWVTPVAVGADGDSA